MGAIELDRMAWPDIKAELDAGRDTVVVAFGATEHRHGARYWETVESIALTAIDPPG